MDKDHQFVDPSEKPPTPSKHFFARPVVVFLALLLFFPLGLYLMYYHKVYTPLSRVILTFIFLLVFWFSYIVDSDKNEAIAQNEILSTELKVANSKIRKLEAEKTGYISQRDLAMDLKKQAEDKLVLAEPYFKELEEKENAEKEAQAKKEEQKRKEAEAKRKAEKERKQKEAQAKAEAEKAEAERKAQLEADKKAKAEAEKKAQQEAEEAAAAAQEQEQQQTIATDFQNCTDLRGTYPDGVPSDHPAYQPKMDRDNDNWACEN